MMAAWSCLDECGVQELVSAVVCGCWHLYR